MVGLGISISTIQKSSTYIHTMLSIDNMDIVIEFIASYSAKFPPGKHTMQLTFDTLGMDSYIECICRLQ